MKPKEKWLFSHKMPTRNNHILSQFMVRKVSATHNKLTMSDDLFSDDTGDDRFVPVLLNSEESTLRFIDRPLEPKVSR